MPSPHPKKAGALSPSLEHYLRSIYDLQEEKGGIPVRFETKTHLGPFVVHLIESRGVASGPLADPPLRKLKGWKGAPRRVEKRRSGGLIELKNLLNDSRIKRRNKKGEAPRPKEKP